MNISFGLGRRVRPWLISALVAAAYGGAWAQGNSDASTGAGEAKPVEAPAQAAAASSASEPGASVSNESASNESVSNESASNESASNESASNESASARVSDEAPDSKGLVLDPLVVSFATRLDRLAERLEAEASDNGAAGVLAVGYGDQHVRTVAFGTSAADAPVAADALFDLGLLTQPVVATAALMLQERGQWLLSDPIGQTLPDFARSEVRVVDLLRQVSGLATDLEVPGRRRNEASPGFDSSLKVARRLPGDAFVRLLADAPPVYRPGLIARHGFDYDVLGVAMSKLTGQSLGAWMLSEMFLPLELWDMGFYLDQDRAARFVVTTHAEKRADVDWRRADEALGFDCAGACLVGTAGDYLRFGQMLLMGGHFNGHRLLSRPSVELMVRNHLGSGIQNRIGLSGLPVSVGGSAAGFGFGVATVGRRALPDLPGNTGAFGLSSPHGHFFWTDPASGLVIVLLAHAPDSATAERLARLTQAMVYGAIP